MGGEPQGEAAAAGLERGGSDRGDQGGRKRCGAGIKGVVSYHMLRFCEIPGNGAQYGMPVVVLSRGQSLALSSRACGTARISECTLLRRRTSSG